MNLKNLLQIAIGISLLGVIFWISYQLFFVSESGNAQVNTVVQQPEVRILYPNMPSVLEPTAIDQPSRQRLANIFEPLIKTDQDLNIKPAIALSWGLIDDTTWHFKLRPDVKFHDKTSLNAEDVMASLNRALKNEKSQLRDILSSIDQVASIDASTIEISTKEPDPLLLQKLALVLIMPAEQAEASTPKLIGTANYQVAKLEPGKLIELTEFLDYWGPKPVFQNAQLITESDKSQRVNSFVQGDADLLTFVPVETIETLEKQGFQIASTPSLEVQFVLFNTTSKVLKNRSVRKALSLAINPADITNEIGTFAKPVNQFVSSGIFGFNPQISEHELNLTKAKELIALNKLDSKTVQVHLPKGLDILGEHLRIQLTEIGLSPIVSYLDTPKLLESIAESKADIYFLAYKSDIGDSGDFFELIADSKGEFNLSNYRNQQVDQMIDQARTELDQSLRQRLLQNLMQQIVEEDIIGMPLFEYDTLFSHSAALDFQPRIDGIIYLNELKAK